MDVRARKAVGCFALVAYIGVYAALASTLAVALAPQLPTWAELVLYAVLGIIWIFPLKPLFGWMNRA